MANHPSLIHSTWPASLSVMHPIKVGKGLAALKLLLFLKRLVYIPLTDGIAALIKLIRAYHSPCKVEMVAFPRVAH